MVTLAEILAGNQDDELKKLAVWNKGHPIEGRDSTLWRQDAFGFWISYVEYGNRDSEFGWEFDHHPIPASKGGSDDVSNLRPLNWRNNVLLGSLLP